jgi:hypothetical protein
VIELALFDGGTLTLVETDGERVVLSSDRSTAPGATLKAVFEGVEYLIKVRGCRLEAADCGTFRIEGRFVNLARKHRELLLSRT